MGKLGDKDWWLGKTEEQQARKARLQQKAEDLRSGAKTTSRGERIAKGPVDQFTSVSIYRDGTFTTTKGMAGVGVESEPDRLLGFDHDSDSMRRKSVTGRAAAAIVTAGTSPLVASNNRGVIYVTVTGERTGARTFTTRNPSGEILTAVRTLKAAADTVITSSSSESAEPPADVMTQIQRLAELHAAGALTDEEFATKKAQLLDRL